MISTETLKESIGEASKSVRDREEAVSKAQAGLAEAERELGLLVELAEIRGLQLPEAGEVSSAARDKTSNGAVAEPAARRGSRGKASLLAAVIDILGESGEPMQIRELMAAVQKRDVTIPGRGQQANLIAHISRDPRITRPRRGFYALQEWDGDAGPLPAPQPRRAGARRRGTSR